MKFLIAGLGNIGETYDNTRHNIGFSVLDTLLSLALSSNCFELKRHALVSDYSFKGHHLVLIKPTTYVNLSGKAVSYWMQKEKIPLENVLIIVDDIALAFGALRLREKGGDGGHNGLKSIIETLGTNQFARLRFGIDNAFYPGQQADYVLSPFTTTEKKILTEKLQMATEIVKSFVSIGIHRTMTLYNKTP